MVVALLMSHGYARATNQNSHLAEMVVDMMDAATNLSRHGALTVFARKRLSVHRAAPEDAPAWLTFLQALDRDTDFMMFEPGERSSNVKKCEEAILRINAVSGAILLLVWDEGRNVVGYIKGDVVPLERKAHVMSVSCALLSAYRGDTGKALIQTLFNEVEQEGIIKRVESAVMASNVRMLVLALSLGCVIEGVRRNAVKLKTGMQDEYVVVKYFD